MSLAIWHNSSKRRNVEIYRVRYKRVINQTHVWQLLQPNIQMQIPDMIRTECLLYLLFNYNVQLVFEFYNAMIFFAL